MSDQENANAAPTTALDDILKCRVKHLSHQYCDTNCLAQQLKSDLLAWNKAQVDKAVVEASKQAYKLWKLLDDIDTLDDAVRSNDKAFREHTRKMQRTRFEIMSGEEFDRIAALQNEQDRNKETQG